MIQDHKEKLQKAIILTVTIAFFDKLSQSAGLNILALLKEMTYYRVHNTRRRREAFYFNFWIFLQTPSPGPY